MPLGQLARILHRRETPSKKTWRRYFEARVAVMMEWYGLSRSEVTELIAEKMKLGFRGDEVFDEVKKELDGRSTKIVDRT